MDKNTEILKKTYSKNGNEILLLSNQSESFKKTILIIGIVHGDEPQGKFLIENFLKQTPKQEQNQMLFIPCLNPDGLILKTRQNANNIDINRNFPTKNWEKTEKNEFWGGETANSEIETKFVTEIINEFKPNLILTIHAPFKIVNYDGPEKITKQIAQKISDITKYPVQKDIGYPTPGSFGTYAGVEKNIPTITLELDEKTDVKNLIQPMDQIFAMLSNLEF